MYSVLRSGVGFALSCPAVMSSFPSRSRVHGASHDANICPIAILKKVVINFLKGDCLWRKKVKGVPSLLRAQACTAAKRVYVRLSLLVRVTAPVGRRAWLRRGRGPTRRRQQRRREARSRGDGRVEEEGCRVAMCTLLTNKPSYPKPWTLNPGPWTLNPERWILNPQP